jgi:hypothetical protein
MIPPTPWAEDDDDGTLDVNDNATLVARTQQATREANALPASSLQAQLVIRTRPLEVPVGSEQQIGYLSGQVDPVQRPGTSGAGAPSASTGIRTNANGIPVLNEGSTSAQNGGVNPNLWNAFAANVDASAALNAAALLQRMQGLPKEASAPLRKPKKRPK